MDEIIIHPYDWRTGIDQETGYTTIHSWGLDKNSESYLLRIHEFPVFCYLELPLFLNNSYIRWSGYKEKIIYEKICQILGDDKPYQCRLEMKQKYYYYKGKDKKYPMLLLCFRTIEAMKKCKNKLKNAFKVHGLKGGRDETMVAVKVWETHIPLVRKMLTLRNCKFSQWFNIKGVKVEGNDKISTLENEYVVDWKTLNPIPLEDTVSWITYPKILSFDIETYSDRHNAMPDSLCSKHVVYLVSVVFQRFLKPETRKKEIVLYGDCSDTNLANVIKVNTEIELIEVLQDLILKYDPEILTGYNIFSYDNPYLENRLKRKLRDWKPLGRLLNEPSEMVTFSWSSSAFKNQDFNILEMSGRISIDLLPVIRRDFKLPIYKLEYVAQKFLKKGKHEVTAKQMFAIFELQECLTNNYIPEKPPILYFKHCRKIDNKEEDRDGNIDYEYIDSVNKRWKEDYKNFSLDEMRKVVDYCVVDSDLVVDLFDKINVWIGLIQISNIMGIVPSDIFTRGTGVRMESQIYDEASRNNIVLDEVDFIKEKYVGGYVADPIIGIHHLIPILDFKSLYPTVQISHNMDHSSFVPPHLMDKIPDENCHVVEWDDEIDEDESDSESDDEEKVKLVKKKKTIHKKFKFVKEPIGIMPKLLIKLIEERNKVRKKQKNVPEGSLEWNVLEQTQLGIKSSTNAFYGSCGSSFSKLKFPFIGEAITAKARESTKKMNAYLENKGHTVVYGDSVTGDTPILIYRNGKEKYICIQDLFKEETDCKSYKIPESSIKVWSDLGFTNIKYVMKHKTKKRLFCIITSSGIIKVTEDHSLLNVDGKEISPKDVKIGDYLLTKEHPNEKSLEPVNKSTIYVSSALEAMEKVKRLKKYNYDIFYEYNDNKYEISVDKSSKPLEKGKILKIIDLGIIDDYVYDLETENHHFSAGVGELVVHNTDSTMPNIGLTDPKTAWEISLKLAKELTSLYPRPMEVELEAIFHTMLSIKKKMYLCIYLDKNGEPLDTQDQMKIRGVTLARRDNCEFQREFYKDIVWKVLHEEPFIDLFNCIIDKCIELLSHSVKWKDLTMIKGLGSHYKSKSYMMNIFSKEMAKNGNPMTPGDRIQYVVVKVDDPNAKLGFKMRTIELFLERAGDEKIDCLYYLEKVVRNGIEKQLYQVGYKKHLEELDKKFKELDCEKVLFELGRKIGNLNEQLKTVRLRGYNDMILKLLNKFNNDKMKVIEYLLEDDSFKKLIKPLYSYYIKRRKGRGRRLSSRIDKEPIMMMVRIARAKEDVMKSIREYIRKPKTIKLNIIKK